METIRMTLLAITKTDLLGAASNFGYSTGLKLAASCSAALTQKLAYYFFNVTEADVAANAPKVFVAHALAVGVGAAATGVVASSYLPATVTALTFRKFVEAFIINVLVLKVLNSMTTNRLAQPFFEQLNASLENSNAFKPLLRFKGALFLGALDGFAAGIVPQIIGRAYPFAVFRAVNEIFGLVKLYFTPEEPQPAPAPAPNPNPAPFPLF